MNKRSKFEINNITKLVKEKHFLLIYGGNGVGKTFLAKEAAKKLCNDKKYYRVISLHKGFDYSDFIEGTKISANENKMLIFQSNSSKIFKLMWESAKVNPINNFVIILDDVQRVNLYSLFGDELNYVIDNALPNFFLIATMNTALIPDAIFDYSLYNKFYSLEIESDYSFIEVDTDNRSDEWKYDFIKFVYNKTNSIIRNYLNYTNSNWQQQFNRYKIGHGYFVGNLPLKLRYQVVPLLKEYVKNGVLIDYDGSLQNELDSLLYESYDEIEMVGSNEFDNLIEFPKIKDSNKYVKKLCEFILEQYKNRLISDDDFFSCIIINEEVFKRVSEDANIPYSAALLTNEFRNDKFYRLTGRKNKSIKVSIDTVGYYSKDQFIKFRNKRYFYPVSTTDDKTPQKREIVIIEECKKTLTLSKVWIPIMKEYISRWLYLIDEYGDNILNNEVRAICNQFKNAKKYNDFIECLQLINQLNSSQKGVKRKMSKQTIIEIMENTGVNQIILQGPPGTSKTYTAKEELEKLIEKNKDIEGLKLEDLQIKDFENINDKQIENIRKAGMCWSIVQFHPSYSYEDFIRGISVSTPDGQPKYDTVNKILGKIAQFANKPENVGVNCYLIIDEINRANVANVFGELIYALEYRNDSVATPYSIDGNSEVKIPDKLYIIGTMNTADKSIGTLDYAIRRRFIFFPCLPQRDVVERYYNVGEEEVKKVALKLFDAVAALFDIEKGYLSFDYYADDVQVGHTYFLAKRDENSKTTLNKLVSKFEFQVLPLLKEYFKDGVLEYSYDDDDKKEEKDKKDKKATWIMKFLKNDLAWKDLKVTKDKENPTVNDLIGAILMEN